MSILERITDDVWAFQRELPLPLGGGLPCRSTIVRLASGKLLVHAPLAIDAPTAKEIDELGEVAHLVAPNCFHWMFLRDAKERWTRAEVFGPASLAKKLGSFAFTPFGERPTFGDELRVHAVLGAPAMAEHVLFHEASKTLIVGDLLFNVQHCKGAFLRFILRIGGAWQKPAQSKVWRFITKDRAAAAGSVSGILGTDFQRIVMAHGDVITVDAQAVAQRALSWMTREAPRALPAVSAG